MTGPVYLAQPIQSVASLCRALGRPEGMLRELAQRAPQLYIGPKPKLKKDGKSLRYVYDTKFPLKPLMKTINQVIFRRVAFPQYLQGSLAGRDYVSNVAIHKDSKTVISEDIEAYFDNITDEHVFEIWRRFFGFGQAPAELLTALTTREGRVFQGTPTSSYLANLAFWEIEDSVVSKLQARGLRYSRYVDDVTISSTAALTTEDKAWAIGQVVAMIGSRGFRTKREKHEIQSGNGRISVMKLNVNRGVGVSTRERAQIRAAVHQLEQACIRCETGPQFRKELEKTSGRIGRLGRFHASEADRLRARLQAIRNALSDQPFQTATSDVAEPLCPSILDEPLF